MPKLSQTAISILTLLNNINDLILQSQDRENARDVMRALNVYASSKDFPLPQDKVDNFYAVLIDSRIYTLSSLLKDMAMDVTIADYKKTTSKPSSK